MSRTDFKAVAAAAALQEAFQRGESLQPLGTFIQSQLVQIQSVPATLKKD